MNFKRFALSHTFELVILEEEGKHIVTAIIIVLKQVTSLNLDASFNLVNELTVSSLNQL